MKHSLGAMLLLVAGTCLLTLPIEASAGEDQAIAEAPVGNVAVLTGDTLRLGGKEVRLVGIEAPAAGAGCRLHGAPFDCARIAATALTDLTAGADVECEPAGRTPQGDIVARCMAGGYDLAEGMTYTGWARAWPREGNRYRGFENLARNRGHGLWRDGLTPPALWQR